MVGAARVTCSVKWNSSWLGMFTPDWLVDSNTVISLGASNEMLGASGVAGIPAEWAHLHGTYLLEREV